MNTLGTKFILANQFIFDPNSNTLFDKKSDDSVRLGSNESRILLMFVLHPLDVIKREELHDFVWRQQGFEVDNSSLTQAISTLRKVLNDSTKSPEFVKTVPKRGYQFIATVEKTTASKSAIQAQNQDPPKDASATNNENITGEAQEQIVLSEQSRTQTDNRASENVNERAAIPPISRPKKQKTWQHHWSKTAILLVILAILIPVITFSPEKPIAQKFTQLSVYKNISIEVPENSPNLTSWIPAIETCLGKYKELHKNQPLPIRLIATGGLENKLSLNYVFSPEEREKNVTITVLANQTELSKVCR